MIIGLLSLAYVGIFSLLILGEIKIALWLLVLTPVLRLLLEGFKNKKTLPLAILIIIMLVFLTGCCKTPPLTVRLEKVGPKHLASHFVGSPDPDRCRFFHGEQLVINWCLKRETPPFLLKLFLVRANHSLDLIERRLCSKRGFDVFYFLGDSWCQKGEILTWRAEIYAGPKLVALACQRPWVEWIENKEG